MNAALFAMIVALATLLVGTGIFAMMRRDHAAPAQAVFTESTSDAPPVQAQPPVQAPTVMPGAGGYEPRVDPRGNSPDPYPPPPVQPIPTILGASPVE